jgi:hypothetical protein
VPSNYSAFDVGLRSNAGSFTPVAAVMTVKVYDVTHAAALPDLATDAAGHVPAGTLAVDPGTTVRFTVTRANGEAGYAEQVTS